MGMRELLLILISFALGVGCIQLIRRLDRFEREPIGKMVLAAIVGGGSAMVIAQGLYEAIEHLGFHNFESAVGALLVIGPVEELAKLLGLVAVYGIIRNELNEPADGIIYIACVALGFSLIENFIYAVHLAHEHLIIIRFLVGTPLHICFSALMGLSFYLWFRNRQAFHLVVTAFFLASLNHGLYDMIVFNHYSILVLGATVLLMYGFARDLFIYALAVSPQRLSLQQSIDARTATLAPRSRGCLHCGSSAPKNNYAIEHIDLQHCAECDHFAVTQKGLFDLFFHFAGVVKQEAGKHLETSDRGSEFMTLYHGNHICPQRKLAFFRLEELNAVIEKQHYMVKSRMRSKWYLPSNLFRLNQPGVAIDYPKMVRDGKGAFWRRMIYPFTGANHRVYQPPKGGPVWNWGAFWIAEIWYARHNLWGAMLYITGIYAVSAGLALAASLPLAPTMGIAALAMRLVSGLWGGQIYYRRYGKWP